MAPETPLPQGAQLFMTHGPAPVQLGPVPLPVQQALGTPAAVQLEGETLHCEFHRH